ncbi:MAG: DUF370 domain-containing protein [Clostridia bacterium]|nr:DUF370 domain-containing protein [Clostridia bacterium]
MTDTFLNVGFGNLVSPDRIIAIVVPDSAPIKRLVQEAKDGGNAIDVSCGRKTRSVLITDSGHVIMSAIQVDTLKSRLSGNNVPDDADQ